MKAPVWGMCCAVVCSAIAGIGVALHVAGQLRAADSMTVTTIGPEAPQLSRPSDGSGKLDYSNPAAWQPNGQVSRRERRNLGFQRHVGIAVGKRHVVADTNNVQWLAATGWRVGAGSIAVQFHWRTAAIVGRTGRYGIRSQQPAPIDGINENNILGVSGTDSANQVSSRNSSRNIQTAYRQPADMRSSAMNSNSSANQPSMRSGGRPAPLIRRWLCK